MSDLKYYIAFSHLYGIGPVRFKKLIDCFGNVKEAYRAKKSDWVNLFGLSLAEKFARFRNKFDPEKSLAEMEKKGIKILTLADKEYPEKLKNISDPPICLYIKGDKKLLSDSENKFFAVVGTRRATGYGRQVTRLLAGELTQYGFVIVSGMAIGIDSQAHWAALNSRGKTIAVLGCGVDIIYPSSNRRLYQEIIERGGAVISEFPPGHTVLPGLFVARNRIISGLSIGVLVIEGAKDSGSLITARYAAEQGRDVFAPPSPITSLFSSAPNLLIKQGAKMVTSIEDILAEYGVAVKQKKKDEIFERLEEREKKIMEILLAEAKTADELVEVLNLSIDEVLNSLTLLEVEGLVEKDDQGCFLSRIKS